MEKVSEEPAPGDPASHSSSLLSILLPLEGEEEGGFRSSPAQPG